MCPRTVLQQKPQTEKEGRPEVSGGEASGNTSHQPNSVFGPLMVTHGLAGGQRNRKRSVRPTKGKRLGGHADSVRGGSRVATKLNRLKTKTGGNGQSGHGSRFGVLPDQTEMDVDKGESSERVRMESNPTENQEDQATGEEGDVETLDVEDESGDRVNLSVSHFGLAEKLRPLGGVKINVRTQAQGEIMGQRKQMARF